MLSMPPPDPQGPILGPTEQTPERMKKSGRTKMWAGFPVVGVVGIIGLVWGIVALASPSKGGGSECLSAAGVTSAIADGLKPGVALTGPIMAVKSKDFQGVYMVASHVTGDSKDIPVWAVTSLSGSGLVTSAEAFSKLYSAYPRHDGVDAGSDGVSQAQSCVS